MIVALDIDNLYQSVSILSRDIIIIHDLTKTCNSHNTSLHQELIIIGILARGSENWTTFTQFFGNLTEFDELNIIV